MLLRCSQQQNIGIADLSNNLKIFQLQEEKQISAKGKRYGETLANSYEYLNKYISLKIFVLAILLINKKTTF